MPFNILDVECSKQDILKKAFTHPSYTKESELPSTDNYERLEFLGDAVLKLVISNLLYEKYPDYNEGDLSKIRSILVSDATLSGIAADIGLNEKLILGSGEEKTGGRNRESNVACAMEAVFGAYYLDGKIDFVEKFLSENLLPLADDVVNHFEKYNSKAVLQEYVQQTSTQLPEYVVVNSRGPAHKPIFEVEVRYNGEVLASGEGKSKKEAQQDAAYKACIGLGIIKDKDVQNDK